MKGGDEEQFQAISRGKDVMQFWKLFIKEEKE
jgi:hypothetical protein